MKVRNSSGKIHGESRILVAKSVSASQRLLAAEIKAQGVKVGHVNSTPVVTCSDKEAACHASSFIVWIFMIFIYNIDRLKCCEYTLCRH